MLIEGTPNTVTNINKTYPGLEDIDYRSINEPSIGIDFYRVAEILDTNTKVKLMQKEAKISFCLNIHYARDGRREKSYFEHKMIQIKKEAGFNEKEFGEFMNAIYTIYPNRKPQATSERNQKVVNNTKEGLFAYMKKRIGDFSN